MNDSNPVPAPQHVWQPIGNYFSRKAANRTNDATINANDAKNDIGGVKNGVSNAGNGVNRNERGTNGGKVPLNKEQIQLENLLQIIEKNPSATQAYYAEEMGVSKRTISRMFAFLQEKGRLVQNGTTRKAKWEIIR